MFDVNLYYCWNCDAHRKATVSREGHANCPRCGHELPPDSRLPVRPSALTPASTSLRAVWPAPLRPRLAASA